MTLPFSDKPEKSSIYQDVKTTTLQDLTPDQFDAFRARMFAEGVNGLEDEYRRLVLLGLASDKLSLSGPMPGTMQLVDASSSTSGSAFTIFRPDQGQVWQLIAMDFTMTGGTGNTTIINYLASTTDSVKIYEVTSASTSIIISDDIDAPIYLTYDVYLRGIWARTSGTEGNYTAAVVRVR